MIHGIFWKNRLTNENGWLTTQDSSPSNMWEQISFWSIPYINSQFSTLNFAFQFWPLDFQFLHFGPESNTLCYFLFLVFTLTINFLIYAFWPKTFYYFFCFGFRCETKKTMMVVSLRRQWCGGRYCSVKGWL